MTFASPWFLVGLALAIPVVVAFLMRRRRSVVRVPSTLLWRGASLRRIRNRKIRDLTRILALVACAAAVIALALATARPRGAGGGETVAVVVDVSASMGRGEGRHTPLARARRYLASMLLARAAEDRYLVIAAGPTPTRLAGPTGDGALLEEALDALAAERGGADLGAAVDLALELVAGQPSPRVVVLHDGGASAGSPFHPRLAPDGVALLERRFSPGSEEGQPGDNLGLVTFTARRPSDAESEDEREVVVTVATSSSAPRRAEVTVEAFGAPLARRRLEVPAGGEAELRVRVQTPAATLVARVAPADGRPDVLEADDAAELTQGAVVPPRALLVASDEAGASEAEAFFATQALRSAGVGEVVRVTPARARQALQPRDVVVVLDELPAERLAAPTLYLGTDAGRRTILPVLRQRELLAPKDATAGDPTRLRSVAAHHPLTRGVSFDGITVHRALAADAPEGARVLVELEGGPVVLAGGDGADGWVYVGLDLSRSDLVLRVAFPVLVANAFALLGGGAQVSVAPTLPRSEVTLRQGAGDAADAPELALVVPGAPAMWLALIAGLLLAAEGLAWRKGWTR